MNVMNSIHHNMMSVSKFLLGVKRIDELDKRNCGNKNHLKGVLSFLETCFCPL